MAVVAARVHDARVLRPVVVVGDLAPTGSASMSARSATVRPGRPPRSTPRRPVRPHARTSMPHRLEERRARRPTCGAPRTPARGAGGSRAATPPACRPASRSQLSRVLIVQSFRSRRGHPACGDSPGLLQRRRRLEAVTGSRAQSRHGGQRDQGVDREAHEPGVHAEERIVSGPDQGHHDEPRRPPGRA